MMRGCNFIILFAVLTTLSCQRADPREVTPATNSAVVTGDSDLIPLLRTYAIDYPWLRKQAETSDDGYRGFLAICALHVLDMAPAEEYDDDLFRQFDLAGDARTAKVLESMYRETRKPIAAYIAGSFGYNNKARDAMERKQWNGFVAKMPMTARLVMRSLKDKP